MDEILGKIYCLFEGVFGQYLAEYLWGYNCQTEVYDGQNLFNIIGLITIGVAFLFALAYYYLPLYFFNHPRSNRWWNWLIILFVSGIVNFFIASIWIKNDFLDGRIGDCLMYTRDEAGEIVAQLIYKSDSWMFGLANFIFSATVFFFCSLVVLLLGSWISNLGSTNCRYTPFKI